MVGGSVAQLANAALRPRTCGPGPRDLGLVGSTHLWAGCTAQASAKGLGISQYEQAHNVPLPGFVFDAICQALMHPTVARVTPRPQTLAAMLFRHR